MTAVKAHTAMDELGDDGAFVRTAAGFREWISDSHPSFKPEKDRYHLYVSWGCPWASRCAAVRSLKGLEDVIGLSVVHPTMQETRPGKDEHRGWAFKNPGDAPVKSAWGMGEFPCDDSLIPDTMRFIRDLYEKAGDTLGKYSVPVLWDKKLKTIVNNESSEIVQMFNSNFQSLCAKPEVDLNPETLKEAQAALDEWIYPNINNGVYRCGFARKQKPYDEAVKGLYEALDKAEGILSKQRYLCGDKLTLMDLKLFMTLVRFDEVYVVHFKCNVKRIADYPNLLGFTREIFQIPEVQKCCNLWHIRTHYYTSHETINPMALVPAGPGVEEDLKKPHGRDHLGKV
uniref:GST C-terminal domain-containing protein n=1 Tax=Chromera velia CCMP2878 TaxID=1169474 RepID=A0A0G4FZX5_9ALVE|eukprot:Cvel_19451.t1-p1 / transcript=Cvel_19451.t1 / gene=Cvel_19451 / organism=Chromera_velia_CCMP2878 / gene_product=Glutathionyl-hydroquinone reductase YqjG, putative / transcript_product=Glutathionyl-hydroquinone reductase YqjG, putative / location=Cvel_scaffold1678:5211-9369(+) / protein_length=341 / sequence_SO=supercontig / SO=protein_coding / is_pseudo=false